MGGRGINSVYDAFLARTVTLSCHVEKTSHTNVFMNEVKRHEADRLLRVCRELCSAFDITLMNEDPTKISESIRREMKNKHSKSCTSMPPHRFVERKQLGQKDRNAEFAHQWLKIPNISSHAEGYIMANKEQEINTRDLKKKREEKENPSFNNSCRYCNESKEDIFHLLASCSHLSSSVYLPVRHDEVGKSLYNAIIQKDQPSHEYVLPKTEIWQSEKIELWWDTVVKTTPKVKHNKPDIVMWNKEDHQCFVIDVCVPLDENVKANEKIKQDRYMPLLVVLKRLYPEYSFSIGPIVIGATGLVTNSC